MSEGSAMKRFITFALAAVVAAGCAATSAGDRDGPSARGPWPDAGLGLVKGSVFDVPTPAGSQPDDSAPGQRPALPRAYAIAPPRVPHAVADFVPVTATQNACLDCHGIKEAKKGDPVPLPASHYVDYRSASAAPGATAAGSRYVCVVCHVPTTNAPSLVENRFRP